MAHLGHVLALSLWQAEGRGRRRRGSAMRRSVQSLVVVAVLLLTTSPAAAGRPPTSTCTLPASDLCPDFVAGKARWTATVVYYVNPTGAPAGFVDAVTAAFDAWETEVKSAAVAATYPTDGSSIDFTFGGLTTRTPFKR